jgi:predicted esterase
MSANPHAGQPIVTAGAPLGTGRAVAIMVHGRNARPEDILTLVPALQRDPRESSVTYLAPAAANRTWYPFSFLTEISRNEPYLSSALSALDSLVRDVVARGIGRERIVLMGFSQGACLASEFAVRHAARYGGVVAFSGGVIGPPGTEWDFPGAFDGTPVFLGCSDVDAHIPVTRVQETAEVFARMGADVVTRLYPGMGHLVNDDEISEARRILDRTFGPLDGLRS